MTPADISLAANPTFALFAYGTLMFPEVMAAVCRSCYPAEEAFLCGYARFLVKNETFPAVTPEKGARTHGLLYRGLDLQTREFLDRFEGALYFRKKVQATLADGSEVDCQTYIIKEYYCHLLTDQPWDPALFHATHLPRFLAEIGNY